MIRVVTYQRAKSEWLHENLSFELNIMSKSIEHVRYFYLVLSILNRWNYKADCISWRGKKERKKMEKLFPGSIRVNNMNMNEFELHRQLIDFYILRSIRFIAVITMSQFIYFMWLFSWNFFFTVIWSILFTQQMLIV